MKITALVENTSTTPDIGAEHGLSLYIETKDHRILFDTGQSNLFEENAKRLSIDLSSVDFVVLSHGHYDHCGGLKRFLEINDHAPVYLSKYAFEPHYNGTEKYIGIDTELKNSDRLIFTDGNYDICEGISLKNYEDESSGAITSNLNTLVNGVFVLDDFRHEHYLMIEENGKKILLSGCSHKGIMNIVNKIKADVIIGGFHFSTLPTDGTLENYAKYLALFDIEYHTCHCTGVEQYEFMKQFIKRLHYLSAGKTIEI